VQAVQQLRVPPDVEEFHALMIRALSEPWGRVNDLAPVAARLVKQDAALAACMARAAQAWPRHLPAHELLGPAGIAPISGNRLLRCVLEAGAVADPALERLLTALRFAALEVVSVEGRPDDGMLDFCCALARQCFLNEQVFAHSDEELARARRLRDVVIAALASNAAIPELHLAVVASYFPLHALPGAESLAARTWSEAMTAVVLQQVSEPAQERQLRAAMAALTEVENDVSRQVQQQYEENPYPRWAKAEPPGPPLPFDQYLRRKLPAAVFRAVGKPQIDLLIAGCGTGQHAIETAQRFSGANVLAVDLSRTSLAYAERKTRELGRGNIAYGQADILKLGSLGRTFDVIESSGVLHHLAEPFAGWRVLLSLLRPGGIMTIGLYSELARAEIVAARAFIAERGYRATAEDIRRCRQDLLDQALLDDHRRFAKIVESADFFSISGCRDLLFHVQEHRLTIPQIAAFLAENDLAFVGFDLDPATRQRYRARFPRDEAVTDLASWDVFEREYPDTFAGMYQFWVQKGP
jgi:SAM-dependent methyltransferase